MYEDETAYDPGLCVGCEVCYFPPRDCPQCKIIPEEDGGVKDNADA